MSNSLFSFRCLAQQYHIKSDDFIELNILMEAHLQDELRMDSALLCDAHFILILNISSSMDDLLEFNKSKLQAVVEALNNVIAALGDNDRLSIITFTTKEKVFCWAELAKNKATLQQKLREIFEYPRGTINLESALKATQANLDNMKNARDLATKLLIVTDSAIYEPQAKKPMTQEFQEVDILGIGKEFIGKDIESLSSGFIEKLEKTSETITVFEKSLRTLQNTVATKVKIKLEPAPGVEIRGITKISPYIKWIAPNNRIVSFGNVDRNRRYAAIVRVLIDPSVPGEKAILTAALDFDIPKKNIVNRAIKKMVIVSSTNDTAKLSKPENSEVIYGATYYTTAIRAQEIQDNSENKTVVLRNLKLIIKLLKRIGDIETMARWKAIREDYILKGEFSREKYSKVIISKSKASTAYSVLPSEIWEEAYDDELTWGEGLPKDKDIEYSEEEEIWDNIVLTSMKDLPIKDDLGKVIIEESKTSDLQVAESEQKHIQRQTDISFPQKVKIGKTYNLRIRIIPTELKLPTGIKKVPKPHAHDITFSLLYTFSITITVHITAENFEIHGESSAKLEIPQEGNSAVVIFPLIGQEVGDRHQVQLLYPDDPTCFAYCCFANPTARILTRL